MIEALSVVCQGETDGIGTLSGGNQQKVMLAAGWPRRAGCWCLMSRFQGVDIRARRDIGRKIREHGQRTERPWCLSAELDEALEIADRIIVMTEHRSWPSIRNEERRSQRDPSPVTGSRPADPAARRKHTHEHELTPQTSNRATKPLPAKTAARSQR
jgi:simple sugar transport system ATP-binding protein